MKTFIIAVVLFLLGIILILFGAIAAVINKDYLHALFFGTSALGLLYFAIKEYLKHS